MTVKPPSYIDTGKEPTSNRPSYVSAMNGQADSRPRPKLKSFAEQTNALSPRDTFNAEGHRGDTDLPTDLHTEPREREIQPPGFQPMPFLRQRVEQFLENPSIKNGYRLYARVRRPGPGGDDRLRLLSRRQRRLVDRLEQWSAQPTGGWPFPVISI